jgi:hypothetical protein
MFSLAFKEGRLVSSFCLEKDRLKNDVKMSILPSDCQKTIDLSHLLM